MSIPIDSFVWKLLSNFLASLPAIFDEEGAEEGDEGARLAPSPLSENVLSPINRPDDGSVSYCHGKEGRSRRALLLVHSIKPDQLAE